MELHKEAGQIIILTFIRYYLPGHKSGGPVRTIANMVKSLGDEFEFRIVTSDRDMLDAVPYVGVPVREWTRVEKAWVYYVPPELVCLKEWRGLLVDTPHDVLYFNSLFDSNYTLLPYLAVKLMKTTGKPVVIAPRGELSPGAIALKSWKKKPFLTLANQLNFYRDVLWHASTNEESTLIRDRMGASSNVAIARNIPANFLNNQIASGQKSNPRPLNGPFRIIFLSRIARMKNLDFALKVLAKVDVVVRFDIWGTLEDSDYWDTCQQLINVLPENIDARYCGVVEHSAVTALFGEYELFFLPTRGENYGHVIAEAVSAGTPLLISDQTPWRDLATQGVGWDLSLDDGEDAFVQAICEAKGKSHMEMNNWKKSVLEYAKLRLCDPSIIEANRQVFLRAINAG